jgi:hypothetical protein
MEDRWVIYTGCCALLMALGAVLELSYRLKVSKVGLAIKFLSLSISLGGFFYFNWAYVLMGTFIISKIDAPVKPLFDTARNFFSKISWFNRYWSSNLKPVTPSLSALTENKFQFDDFCVDIQSDIQHPKNTILQPDSIKFKLDKSGSWKTAEWFCHTYKVYGSTHKYEAGKLYLDACFLQSPDSGLLTEDGFIKFVSTYIYGCYFAPPGLNQYEEIKRDNYGIEYDSVDNKNCQISFICSKGNGFQRLLNFYSCSDNKVLLVEAEYWGEVPSVESAVKELYGNILSSIKILSNQQVEKPITFSRAVGTSVKPPEPFDLQFPSITEFEKFLYKHAEDPVKWAVFQKSPNYSGWFGAQYSAHRIIYKRLLNEYNKNCLENFRV